MYEDLAGSGDLLREQAPPDDAGAIRFRRERDLGDVVNVTFRFLRDNAAELGRGLLVIVGPVALVAAMVSAWAQLQMEAAVQGAFDPADSMSPFGDEGYVTGLILTVLAVVAMQLLIQAVVLGYVERYRRGAAGTITPAVLWEATKEAFRPVMSTMLVAFALYFVLAVAALIITVAVPLVGFLAVLALLAAGIYFFPILTLLYVERVAEGDGFWEGFAVVRDLVRGHWWQTFGLLVVVTIIVVVIVLVLSIPGVLVEALFSFNTLDGGGALRIVGLAVSALFGVLAYAAYAIPVLASAFQYLNLVERKEGTGLLGALDALAGPAEEAAVPAPSWRPPEAPSPARPPAPPAERGFRGGGFHDGGEEWGR